MPYFKSNEINLFPIIPTSVLKTSNDSSANRKKYFDSTKKETEKILTAMTNILEIDLEKLSDEGVQNKLNSYSNTLGDSFRNLSEIEIPPKYLNLHKNLMISVISAKKIVEVMKGDLEDPLKSLMTLNQMDSVTYFWQQTLNDYAKTSATQK